MINLVNNTIGNDEIDKLIVWLKKYPHLTKGSKTIEFEEKFSNWIGTEFSVFCNSGSSANLLMLHAIKEKIAPRKNLQKVVVPAVAWATDLSPVMQLGMQPIICDCNLDDLSVDLGMLEDIFIKENPIAVILVSILGLVPQMDDILKLCDDHNVILLEDSCESVGSMYKDKKLGNFGMMSTFSTYYGHHFSTIEGGFINTNDKNLYELLLSLRSHGWDRDLSERSKFEIRKKWGVSEFDSLYTFYYPAYNFRSTDLQAFIGINQIDNLNKWVVKRQKNFLTYNSHLKNSYWMPKLSPEDYISNFAYPVIHPNKKIIIEKLQNNDIEVRPLVCGSMGTQPFYVKQYGMLKLKNASVVDNMGFYVPNHPQLSKSDIVFICNIINSCI